MVFAFLKDELGAVSVDWTVMTAAIVGLGVGLGLFAAAAMRTGTINVGQGTQSSLSSAAWPDLRWAFARDLVSQNFADGHCDGWSRARQSAIGARGVMQGQITFGRPFWAMCCGFGSMVKRFQPRPLCKAQAMSVTVQA